MITAEYRWVPYEDVGDLWLPRLLAAKHRASSLSSRSGFALLGDICRLESGRYIAEYVGAAEPDSRPYLRVDNIRPFCANLNPDDVARVACNDQQISSGSVIREDDVVIARTGTLGKAVLADATLDGAIASQHVTRMSLTPSSPAGLNAGFLCAFLNSPLGREQLLSGGAGSTRLELTHARLASLRIPLLSATDMARIGSASREGSRKLFAAARRCQEAIALYDELLGARSDDGASGTHLWIPEDRVAGQWVPRVFFEDIETWRNLLRSRFQLASLGDLARIRRGKGTKTSHYATDGIPFVRTSSIINGGIDPFPDHYASPDTAAAFKQPTSAGDILLSIEGKIGEVAILGEAESCAFKNHIEHIRVNASIVDPYEVFLLLSSKFGKAQIRSMTVVQATIPGLASRSRQILVPVGPTNGKSLTPNDRKTRQRALELARTAVEMRSDGIRMLREVMGTLASLSNAVA